ncbi:MAG: TetR family transcriptional regulator [Ideonella sp.]|nr:TetR family transcriptional regulator [Ideonella sp.]MCC7455516.1 TetR family transcriptional regulator [Nitrospira sp.]
MALPSRSASHHAPPARAAARTTARPASRSGSTTAARPPGTRDPEQTRARILAAAKAEFARVGLGGARVDRIAALAGANKRMLYYYFDSKDGLFRAVLEATYEHIRESEKALHLDALGPVEAIRRLITFTWDYHLHHPEFLSLLNSANLHRAEHVKSSSKVRRMHSPFVAMIGEILERGRKAGVFRSGVDAVQLYISIAALAYFYLGNNYTLSAIFGRDLKAKKALEQRLAHMTELVLGYLRRS